MSDFPFPSSMISYSLLTLLLDLFSHLIVNGTVTPEFKYVRWVSRLSLPSTFDAGHPNTKSFILTQIRDVATPASDSLPRQREDPQYDIYSTNVTCGRSAINSAANTATADVLAGSEIGFRLSGTYVRHLLWIFSTQ